MGKKFIDIIKEVADRYDVKLKKVENKEDAGIFINIKGKHINVNDVSDDDILNDFFGNTLVYKDINPTVSKNVNIKKFKKITSIKKNKIEGCFDYYEDKEKVA